MKKLYEEIRSRFPEIPECSLRTDADNATMLMWNVVYWLNGLGPSGITPDIENRVVGFAKWCEEQPRGKSASDDLFTKYAVSFFEKLFDSDATRPLLPKICDYKYMIQNVDYLKQWVGEEQYELALNEFKEHGRRRKPIRHKRLGSRKRQ